MKRFRAWWFRVRSFVVCQAAFKSDDPYEIRFCQLTRGHPMPWHDDGQACWPAEPNEGWRDKRKAMGW